ncbi:unnamed protein product [Adineta steineri]|uniref:Uncharacterized protein n=1 Tax=Adineta steineri TaxID=433720 RepID=A0A814R3A5_9BILA|nr:unnamed protein product [Adineta steineri]CAF4031174.1 unnamed protein product [Adineta steineri]
MVIYRNCGLRIPILNNFVNGLFEGFRLVYVVSNLEFMQEVFVSQLRSIEQWTRQRRILNPTLESCTDIFIEKLTSTISNEIINIQEFYLRLSMDIVCN